MAVLGILVDHFVDIAAVLPWWGRLSGRTVQHRLVAMWARKYLRWQRKMLLRQQPEKQFLFGGW
tara:strand:- start:1540 stop:1731 length:192 start_codon:yes stop_codon:yes gene_type:complete